MAFAISPPQLGVDFTASVTNGIPAYQLGAEVLGSDGILYKYVRTTAAKAKGFCYLLDQTHTVGAGVTTSAASVAPVALCIPQTAITAPDSGVTYSYGWVGIQGPLVAVGSTAPQTDINTEIYTSSNVGQLCSSNVSGAAGLVPGFKFTTAATVASTVYQAFASKRLGVDSV